VYAHNNNAHRALQAFVSPPFAHPSTSSIEEPELEATSEESEALSAEELEEILEKLEPMEKHLFHIVLELGKNGEKVQIKHVQEATGFGYPSISKRLNHLVEIGLLSYIPGSGRRPSLFYPEFADDTSTVKKTKRCLTNEELLPIVLRKKESIEQEIVAVQQEMQKKIDSLRKDLDELHQESLVLDEAIRIGQKYLGPF
jgi:DNA-binding transcriptional regulator GbsR (MarR family)